MAKMPTMDEWAERLGNKVINKYVYEGRTLKEWIDLMASGKMVKAVWCMEHLEDFKKEIDEKSEIHSDGEFYIKNLDVKRIIDKHLSELEGDTDGK